MQERVEQRQLHRRKQCLLSGRPGTVDYSKWDNLSVSSSEASEEGESEMVEVSLADSDSASYSDESEESSAVAYQQPRPAPVAARLRRPTIPTPSLATLQRAWGTNITASNSRDDDPVANKLCASCSATNPRFRCSRCRNTWYCDVGCQRQYHSIHRLECVDLKTHKLFWGFLDKDKDDTQDESAIAAQLQARQMAKRRRALKRAAAAAAVERARLARISRGTENKVAGNAKKNQEKEETCAVCQCEFTVSGDAGVSLCCPACHFMCYECSGVYVKSILGDLETSYPPKCPMCRAVMPLDHFERQLTKQQQVDVKTFVAKRALKPGQELVKCDECQHFEVTSLNPVVWWCDECGHGTCRVCNKELPRNAQKYDIETSPHAVCKALGQSKALVEAAIEEGSKMKCPGCGLAGRKDDACTHMNCPKCSSCWCYVCGLDVKDCDKAPPREGRPADDIFLHNQGWEENKNRCPMYLTQILEVDMNWLGENWEETARDADFEDDEKCLDYFHRFQTIRKLQEVRDMIGPDDFAAVFENFDSIKNSGYTLEEIIATSTDTLIDREEEYLQYRMDDHQDEEQEDDEENGAAAVDDEMEVWEQLPAEMTHVVVMEEHQMNQAIEASRVSLEEDNQIRDAMDVSLAMARNETDNE